MKFETPQDKLLVRYLLDNVTDAERQEIEERFFQDDAFFEELNALEDELHYEYKQDRLSRKERAAFEQKFLRSAQDKEKSAFADSFLQATAELSAEKAAFSKKPGAESPASLWQSIIAFFNFSNPAMQIGFAAASILLFLGLIGFFIQNAKRQDERASLENIHSSQQQNQTIAQNGQQAQTERQPDGEKSQSEQNEKQIQEPEIAKTEQHINQPPQKTVPQTPKIQSQPSVPQPSIVGLILSPGMFTRSKGEGMSRVTISPSVKNLQLSLLLKNAEDYKSYRVAVKTLDEGTQIWASGDLKPPQTGKNKRLSFRVPTKNLQTADYEISLNGITAAGETEEITSYYFSAVKRGVK